MRTLTPLVFITATCLASCTTPHQQSQRPASLTQTVANPNSLQSLHLRLDINPTDGSVTYLGWYDGRRNLLGPGGISAALVGIEPPEFHNTKLEKPTPTELRFKGLDQNQIAWEKTYRLDPEPGNKVDVTYRITSHRDEAFDAILYSLADLPDATFTGDNRDLHIQTPIARAHFHAFIQNPNFPGEQMSPYAMRSDSKRLQPGASMEFRMTWGWPHPDRANSRIPPPGNPRATTSCRTY
jgi:hypothetical protein